MKVLLSIKPEFAEKIFDGIKKYEYRRSIFKRENINKIIVYASAPVSKVVGEFEVGEILYDDLQSLWDDTKSYSGISKDYFLKYFFEKDKGYAIKIKNINKYTTPLCLKEAYGVTPPQSFVYVS
jgi:predicted transcriptional regulator